MVLDINKEHGNSDRLLAIELEKRTGHRIAHSTVSRILQRNGRTRVYKSIKPNPFKRRYSAAKPLERVQSDTLWTGLEDKNGNRVYMVGFIDDHSRLAYGELHDAKGGQETTQTLNHFIEKYGKPKLVQTDNGTEFTNLYISFLNSKRQKEAALASFEQVLIDLKIEHHLIRPRTPQHNGKIERFNQTVLREFAARVPNHLSLIEYQKLFAKFLEWYNNTRVHSSLNYLTPSSVFQKGGVA